MKLVQSRSNEKTGFPPLLAIGSILVLILDCLLNKRSKSIELKLKIAYLELYHSGNYNCESIKWRVHSDHGQGVTCGPRVCFCPLCFAPEFLPPERKNKTKSNFTVASDQPVSSGYFQDSEQSPLQYTGLVHPNKPESMN